MALLAVLLASCSGGIPGPGPSPTPTATPTPTPSPSPTPCAPTTSLTYRVPSGNVIHIMPPKGAGWVSSTCAGPLLYLGGPVQTVPAPKLVFWGDWSTANDPDGVRPLLTQFYLAMLGSAWLSTATQYTEADGKSVSNPVLTTIPVWNDTSPVPAIPVDADIATEATKAAAHFGDFTANAAYVIAVQHGSEPDGFGKSYCAWHSSQGINTSTVAFVNLPYQPDSSACGEFSVNSVTDGVTIVAGHEQAEIETDPLPVTGWADSQNSEIGDKCAWTNLQETAFGGQLFVTQPLWSNKAGGCVQ